MKAHKRIKEYLVSWKCRDYDHGIPDEVPIQVAENNLAPSWRAIAVCLLKNDMNMTGLGFSSFHSEYYDALKQQEIAQRPGAIVRPVQMRLPL